MWYNRGNHLITLSITDWDKHGQNFCPEPVPSLVLKGAKVNLLIRTASNCKVQNDLFINDLQLFHAAVDELIQALRTPDTAFAFDANIWTYNDGVHSNDSFVIIIMLVQRQLSGTVSLKSWIPSYDLCAYKLAGGKLINLSARG